MVVFPSYSKIDDVSLPLFLVSVSYNFPFNSSIVDENSSSFSFNVRESSCSKIKKITIKTVQNSYQFRVINNVTKNV